MVSRIVCCCGANTWSLVIGWLQTILTGFYFLFHVGATLYFTLNLQINDPDAGWEILKWVVLASVATCIPLLFSFVTGIILIKGVKQENVRYLELWMVFEVILLLLAILGFIILLATAGIILIHTLIYVPIAVYCIWVVNVYQKELILRRLEMLIETSEESF